MTAPAPQAWYVYGAVPGGAPVPSARTILPGAAIEAIRFGSIAILASVVPRGLFDQGDPANRTADPDWMAARVEAHHAVNAAAAAIGPTLPLAFGTLFSNLDLLRDWLMPRSAALLSALERVNGQSEWALSLQEDETAHAAWLDRNDPALSQLAESAANAERGTAYLLGRRLDKARSAARIQHLNAIAASVANWVRAAGFDLFTDPPRNGMPAWTALTPDQAPNGQNALPARVGQLAADLAHAGLSLRLSGPWPAYAFARHALSQESVNA